MQKKYLLIFVFLFGILDLATAQATNDKSELERERREIQDELKEIQSVYNKVKGQKKQSLGQLNMLNRKITLQEKYITSINKELRYIDDDMYRSNIEISRLQKQLDTLKSQYARTVVYAYKNRSSFDYVNFIFSANNFNDAIRRVSYLKSYRAYREKQVNTIYETKDLIAKRQQEQLGRKQEKSMALQSQNKERVVLTDQRKEKDAVVNGLKSQEKDLQKQISSKKKRDADLKNAIYAIIRREVENAKKEEMARVAAAKKAADDEKARNTASAPSTKPSTNNNTPAATVTVPAKKPSGSYLELNAKDVALG
ncbi:MAG TPA: hypothetical protein VK644_13315, partial [Chitinophagaceae bacterium]|nr:hypothetical protein [Chitinophagaceae bacterium]